LSPSKNKAKEQASGTATTPHAQDTEIQNQKGDVTTLDAAIAFVNESVKATNQGFKELDNGKFITFDAALVQARADSEKRSV
jgi:hypothetical protein